MLDIIAMALALGIAVVVLIPASIWRQPTTDATYTGFDPNLMYASNQGPGTTAGTLVMTPDEVRITALAGSHPTIHLATTPLSFSASLKAKVVVASKGDVPLRIGVWSPTTQAGYFLLFDSSSNDDIVTEAVVDGEPRQDLVGGTPVHRRVLGQFQEGATYDIGISVDKVRHQIAFHVSSPSLPPSGHNAVKVGLPAAGATVLNSRLFPVSQGHTYSLGAWTDAVAGSGTYAIGVLWADKSGHILPSDPDTWWKPADSRPGWVRHTNNVTAPSNAAYAQIFLGAGPNSSYLFGQVFFADAADESSNLLLNGSFASGLTGWSVQVGDIESATVVDLTPIDAYSTLTSADSPQVFQAFRPTLTVSVLAHQGLNQSQISNLSLTLPSQPGAAGEEVHRIDDSTARGLVTGTLLLAAAMTVFGMILWLWHQRPIGRLTRSIANTRIPLTSSIVITLGSVAYVMANASLFGIGSPHFDVAGPRIWTYIALHHGISDLYFRTLLVPAASVANGVPWHEAVFPYGITKGYYYLGLGAIYRYFLNGPHTFDTSSFSLEVLIKLSNVLFALIDGILVYLLLKRSVSGRDSLVAALLWILNPAVIFVTAVWGATEAVSLFFILLSLWLAETKRPFGAWLALGAAAFTRPQMFVFALFLAPVLLRKFWLRSSLTGLAWATIVVFLFLSPFALAISPSVPIDYILQTFSYHVANGQADPPYLATTPGYYSVWTLPLEYVSGHHGLERMWSPSTQDLVGNVTYSLAGNGLAIGLMLLVTALIFVGRWRVSEPGSYLPWLAVGVYFWLTFTPGLISRYFIYGLIVIILCRRFFSLGSYVLLIVGTSIITLVTSYGHISLDFLGYGATDNLLNPLNNPVSRFVFQAFSNDRIITLGTLANLAILFTLVLRAISSGFLSVHPFRQLTSSLDTSAASEP